MASDWSLLAGIRGFALPHYQSRLRAYHNDWYIRTMLVALAERGMLTPALALAVWGHDLIYDAHAKDNEERSAATFDDWLAQKGAAPPLRAQVKAMILATKHATPPQIREEALLVDADLSILGAEAGAFAAYSAGIRQEYAHVPEPLYRAGRQEVLQDFLQREKIYSTPEFAELEQRARANLRQEWCDLLGAD